MVKYDRWPLSGSFKGKPVTVSSAPDAVTVVRRTIHGTKPTDVFTPGPTVPGTIDEVWIWCHNQGSNTVKFMQLDYAGATAYPLTQKIPHDGQTHLVVPGLPMATGKQWIAQSTAGATQWMSFYGYVNRMTPT